MGGDQIVTEWLGDTYGDKITTTTSSQRLSAISLRMRTLRISNSNAGMYAMIGKYYSDSNAFKADAFVLSPWGSVTFNFVDLYEMGCIGYGGTYPSLKILGINEY